MSARRWRRRRMRRREGGLYLGPSIQTTLENMSPEYYLTQNKSTIKY